MDEADEPMGSGSGELIAERREALRAILSRDLPEYPPDRSTPDGQHEHLLEEAQELYRSELSWEEESGEESTDSGEVTELVFPGTLALIDALITDHERGDRGEGEAHRDVVGSFLDWLAGRLMRLRTGETGGGLTGRAKEADLTDRLIDLVLYRYCGLSAGEIERFEASRN